MRNSENILQKIEDFLIETYAPGERIMTETELAEHFGVGRSTIRENMSILATMGLISRSTSGTTLAESITGCLAEPFRMIINMQKSNIGYLLELRNILEINSFALAVNRVTAEDLERLEYLLWKMSNPEYHPEEFAHSDYEFHNTISSISGNAIMVELVSALRLIIMEHSEGLKRANADPALRSETLNDHRKLIQALRDKDIEGGIRALRKHLDDANRAFAPEMTDFDHELNNLVLVAAQET